MRTIAAALASSALLANSALAADKAGYVLLDKMVTQFHQLAEASPGKTQQVREALDEMMALARKAQDEKRIDDAFFRRYTRVLMVMRLVIIDDPQRILVPLAEREFASFTKDTTGIEAEGKASVPALATAISAELDNLKTYLDAH
jgi:hypothetical protein